MLNFKILHCSFCCNDRHWLVILSMDDAWRRLTFNSTNTAIAHRYSVQRRSTVHLDDIIKYNIYLATRQIYIISIYLNTSNTTVIVLSINNLQKLVYFSLALESKYKNTLGQKIIWLRQNVYTMESLYKYYQFRWKYYSLRLTSARHVRILLKKRRSTDWRKLLDILCFQLTSALSHYTTHLGPFVNLKIHRV